MSENLCEEANKLLSSIFYSDMINKDYLIFRSTTKIPELLKMLNSFLSIDINMKILSILKKVFNKVRHYMEIFVRYYITTDYHKRADLYLILLNQYIVYSDDDDQVNEEDKRHIYCQTIIEVLELMISNVTCPMEVFEFIYALFQPYLSKEENPDVKVLTIKRFQNYFNLMRIIYGRLEKSKPYEYFYFSGQGEMIISFIDHGTSGRNAIDFNEPFAIFTWFKVGLTKEDIKSIFSKSECHLIRLQQADNSRTEITLDLNNSLRSSTDSELSIELNETKWHMLTMAFDSSKNPIEVKLFLNGVERSVKKASINKKVPITFISLFKNFTGEVTSIFFIKGPKYISLFKILQNKKFKYGIKSEKELIILNKTLETNIYDNYVSVFHKKVIPINHKGDRQSLPRIKDFMMIYMPNRFEEENETEIKVRDPISEAKIKMSSSYLNGIHIHKRHSRDISTFHGLFNLLPLAEMIGISSSPIRPYPLLNNILTQEVVDEFCMLIVVIKGNLSKNKSSKELIDFLLYFALFLEKIPQQFFSSTMFEYLKTLVISNDFIVLEDNTGISFINETILKVFLNESIFFKFNEELHEKIWDIVKNYLMKNPYCSINMSKICSILLEYDKEKHSKYCCTEHASTFRLTNNEVNVQTTDIRGKINHMTNVIIRILKKNPNEIVSFYSLLTKETSPCLQSFIITLTSSLFEKNKDKMLIKDNKLYECLKKDNFFINVTLFSLSVALFDVRLEIILLIFQIAQLGMAIKLTHQQSLFIQNNIVPVYLIIEKISKSSQNNIEKLESSNSIIEKIKKPQQEEGEVNPSKVEKILGNVSWNTYPNENNITPGLNIQTTISIPTIDEVDCQMKTPQIKSKTSLSKLEIGELKHSFFPQNLCQDAEMTDIPGYRRIVPNNNEEFISKYYCEEKFNESLRRMYAHLYGKLTEESLKSLIVSCFIKLSPLLDLACNTTFIQILDNQDDSYLQSLSNNKDFHHWLLETIFQSYIMKDLKLKGALRYSPLQCRDSLLTELGFLAYYGLNIFKKIIQYNIYILDYFLQWCTYYKKLYENDDQFAQCLHRFISHIFSEIFSTIKKLESTDNSSSSRDFLYFSSILFEYLTIFHFGTHFDANSLKSKLILDIPQYYSTLFQNSFDESKRYLQDKWSNYLLFKTIYSECSSIWLDNAKYSTFHNNDSYQKVFEKPNLFIDQLKLLTYTHTPETPDSLVNKGIPLIVMLSNLMATTINEIETEKDLEEWLPNYNNFLKFIIISSTNLNNSDNNSQQYEQIQSYSKDVIAFGICFLINQCSKKTIALSTKIIQVIRRIFKLIQGITKEITQAVSFKKPQRRTSFQKIFKNNQENLINGSPHKTNCAVFKLFNTNAAINGKPFFQHFDVINTPDNDFKKLFNDNNFRLALVENPDLKAVINNIFIFTELSHNRANGINLIIPIYVTFCSYDSSDMSSSIRLDNNYIETDYYEAQDSILKAVRVVRKQFDLEMGMYRKKNQFDSGQLSRNYQKLKKKLFSFRGLWSKRALFYDQKKCLKYKVLNHLTMDYTRPLLFPVVDYENYIPQFSQFKKKNMFNNKVNAQNLVEIDTCKYFINDTKDGTDNDKGSKLTKGQSRISEVTNNKNDELPQNKISKVSFDNMISRINQTLFKSLNNNRIQDEDEVLRRFIIRNSKFTLTNTEHSKNETQIPVSCCFIKPAYHIKGYFIIDSRGILFYAYDWDILSDYEFYDHERCNCFGSTFKTQIKQKRDCYIYIPYNKIERVIKRKSFFRESSLEVFTIYKKSYLFNFMNKDDMTRELTYILRHFDNKPIKTKSSNVGYENLTQEFIMKKDLTEYIIISKKYNQWINWKISTLEMLMCVNLLANRSYNDVSQYPVFPWVLTDYTSNSIQCPLRDLIKPIGMLEVFPESNDRKKNYIQHYESMLEDKKKKENEDTPYMYGTHYSNAMYVCYYLMRLFPFSYMKVELQGNSFDNPNRLFNSLKTSFYCVATQQSDLRELIPEFFCLPEMFDNINDFDFGEIENEQTHEITRIQSVALPEWCKNDPYHFIADHRLFLESKEVSEKICHWLDLIFGVNQKTVKDPSNLYREETYEDFEDKYNGLLFYNKQYMCRMLEFGVTPHQIFYKEAKKRKGFGDIQSNEMDLKVNVKVVLEKGDNFDPQKGNSRLMIQSIKKNKNLLISDSKAILLSFIEKEKNSDKILTYEPTSSFRFKDEDLKTPLLSITKNHIIVTYNEGKCIIKGGYLNGQICAKYSCDNENFCKYYLQEDMNPVVSLAIDQEEKFLFCGTQCGIVHIYFISQITPVDLILYQTINDHKGEITAIHINNRLNVFATASSDDYIMLYTMPLCKLFNSIKVSNTSEISYLFVSSSPLPCFVYYDMKVFTWYSYSINGHFLHSIEKSNVVNVKFFTSNTFTDYIIYSTDIGSFEIISLPFLNSKQNMKTESNFDHLLDFDISSSKKSIVVLGLIKGDLSISDMKLSLSID